MAAAAQRRGAPGGCSASAHCTRPRRVRPGRACERGARPPGRSGAVGSAALSLRRRRRAAASARLVHVCGLDLLRDGLQLRERQVGGRHAHRRVLQNRDLKHGGGELAAPACVYRGQPRRPRIAAAAAAAAQAGLAGKGRGRRFGLGRLRRKSVAPVTRLERCSSKQASESCEVSCVDSAAMAFVCAAVARSSCAAPLS